MKTLQLNMNAELYARFERACKADNSRPVKELLEIADTISMETDKIFSKSHKKWMDIAFGEGGWKQPTNLRIAKPRTKIVKIKVTDETHEGIQKTLSAQNITLDNKFEDNITDYCKSTESYVRALSRIKSSK